MSATDNQGSCAYVSGVISIETAEYFVSEGELYAAVTLVRSGDLSSPATVTVATHDEQAIASLDYQQNASTVDFGKNVSRKSLTLAIVDDTSVEPDESFQLTLEATDLGTSLGPRKVATVTITDDDAARSSPEVDALIPAYRVSAEQVGRNFRAPVTMAFVPDSTLALVAEKSGYIKVLDTAKDTVPNVLLDLREEVNSYGERGLLGLALHPDFASEPYLYAFFSVDPPGTSNRTGAASRDGKGNRYSRLVRFTLDMSGSLPAVVKNSRVVLLGNAGKSLSDLSGGGTADFTDPSSRGSLASNVSVNGFFKRDFIKVDSTTHVGGALSFGPDGALYVGIGDGSSFLFADPRALGAQSIDSLNGKILRIDPLTGEGFADNPFANRDLDENRAKVWAIGLRNPFAMAFAPDGRLFASDTGWNSWEEVEVISKGANYGWPYFEGGDAGTSLPSEGFSDSPENRAFYDSQRSGQVGVTPAFRAFSHDEAAPGYQVGAIVGASSIYTGKAYPVDLQNGYFFTDIVDGEIYSVATDAPDKVRYITDLGAFGPTSLTQGPDGKLYLTDMINDRVLRLEIYK